MRRIRFAAVAALVAAVFVPAAHAAKAPPLFPTTVRTQTGDVTLAKRPTRVVSLSPTATEDLFAIGAGPQVVAVDDQSNYPRNAPKTTLSGFRPNVEAIAAYRPDLVVVTFDTGIVAQLQKLSIPVLFQPPAKNLGEAYEQIRQLGTATGLPKRAAQVVRTMQVQLTTVLRSVPRAQRRLSVFHEVSPDGYAAASNTFVGRIYTLFGFRNIADAADTTKSGYPQVSSEYVIQQNPQLIVLADTKCCNQSAATVAARPGWAGIEAVRKRRVVAMDDDVASRWAPRIVQFARALAAAARAT